MAWEERGARKYFYTAERINGRVVKTYHPGVTGEEQAKQLEQQQKDRRNKLQTKKAEREQRQLVDDAISEIAELVGLAVVAHALLNHHHFHRGDWRQFLERSQTTAETCESSKSSQTTK